MQFQTENQAHIPNSQFPKLGSYNHLAQANSGDNQEE